MIHDLHIAIEVVSQFVEMSNESLVRVRTVTSVPVDLTSHVLQSSGDKIQVRLLPLAMRT